ncbi:Chromatin structure-remodeling complex subunit SFH1 [Nakaseomyces bracarensis]|uniref:Chromatin structure-remodeling complex subunit SFH1 n=1 Tax=Nakaseomyces bracarensis TaxID=273131 RepID=A0ABR4NS00_9SACH
MSSHRAVPQGYLTNLQFRIRNDGLTVLSTAQPSRGHKRGNRNVNYAEFDNDLLEDFSNFPTFDIDSDENDDREGSSNTMEVDDVTNQADGDSGRADSVDVPSVTGAGSGMTSNTSASNNNTINNNTATGGGSTTVGQDGGKNSGRSATNAELEKTYKNGLPDIYDQKDSLNVLRYQRVRESFQHGKIAVPYRLHVPAEMSAEQHESILIPISLNLEHGNNTIQDSFMWNVNDNSITVEDFVTTYCHDLGIYGNTSFYNQIVSAINDQVREFENIAAMVVPELEVIVNLTCNIQGRFYEDFFQWNLNDKSLTPEKFAHIVVQDLGLSRQFIPGIAHSLHEYLLKMKKEWAEGNLTQDHVPNEAAFGYLTGIRLNIDDLGANWCPRVQLLTQEEIQKREIEKERNLRRLKRESERMGGVRRGRRRLDDLELTMRI